MSKFYNIIINEIGVITVSTVSSFVLLLERTFCSFLYVSTYSILLFIILYYIIIYSIIGVFTEDFQFVNQEIKSSARFQSIIPNPKSKFSI